MLFIHQLVCATIGIMVIKVHEKVTTADNGSSFGPAACNHLADDASQVTYAQ